jgi:hypothetical protein
VIWRTGLICWLSNTSRRRPPKCRKIGHRKSNSLECRLHRRRSSPTTPQTSRRWPRKPRTGYLSVGGRGLCKWPRRPGCSQPRTRRSAATRTYLQIKVYLPIDSITVTSLLLLLILYLMLAIKYKQQRRNKLLFDNNECLISFPFVNDTSTLSTI